MGLPGKSILRDLFSREKTFSLYNTENQFPGRPNFIQFIPGPRPVADEAEPLSDGDDALARGLAGLHAHRHNFLRLDVQDLKLR